MSERDNDKLASARASAMATYDSIVEMVDALHAANEAASAYGYDSEAIDKATRAIHEDALSVEVRSDWVTVGSGMSPAQFNILLCTGGPAVRIMGELDEHGEPYRAWLECQDWGTPWTQVFNVSQDTLLAYASCFYFGER